MGCIRKLRKKNAVRFKETCGFDLCCWNGLITVGKERPNHLIKTLKPMAYVYLSCYDIGFMGTAYRVPNGFLLRNYSLDPDGKELRFVSDSEVSYFHMVKYVGCKNVFRDSIDNEHYEQAKQLCG